MYPLPDPGFTVALEDQEILRVDDDDDDGGQEREAQAHAFWYAARIVPSSPGLALDAWTPGLQLAWEGQVTKRQAALQEAVSEGPNHSPPPSPYCLGDCQKAGQGAGRTPARVLFFFFFGSLAAE